MKEYIELSTSGIESDINVLVNYDYLWTKIPESNRIFGLNPIKKIPINKFLFSTEFYYFNTPSCYLENKVLPIFDDFKGQNTIGHFKLLKRWFEPIMEEDCKNSEKMSFSEAEIIPIQYKITSKEKEYLEYGLWPRQMEDKWLMYVENDCIHFHRSWTGIEVFRAKLQAQGAHWLISELISSTQFEWSTQEKIKTFNHLVFYRIDALKEMLET